MIPDVVLRVFQWAALVLAAVNAALWAAGAGHWLGVAAGVVSAGAFAVARRAGRALRRRAGGERS